MAKLQWRRSRPGTYRAEHAGRVFWIDRTEDGREWLVLEGEDIHRADWWVTAKRLKEAQDYVDILVFPHQNPKSKKGAPWGQYITAYHCGSLPPGKEFDRFWLGTGEGFRRPPLGPGLYFSDNLTLARLYCKYAKDPTITTVRLNMAGVFWGDELDGAPTKEARKAYEVLLNNYGSWGVNMKPPYDLEIHKNGSARYQSGAIRSLESSIPLKEAVREGKSFQSHVRKWAPLWLKAKEEDGKRTRRVTDLEDKVYEKRSVPRQMGAPEANRVLVGLGIKGVATRIRPDALEIAIFDPSSIEVLDARRTVKGRSVHRNPISKRMLKIRQQYKPEVYEVTARIVARATDTDPESFDEWMSLRGTGRAQEETEAWDKYIPWLAKNVNDLLKKQKRGAKVQGELDRLERSFKDTVQPFLRPKKKGQKRPDLMKLSPKEARQYAARVQKALAEKRSEEAERLGFKVVAKLGDGYRAVEALPNLKAPPYPGMDIEMLAGELAFGVGSRGGLEDSGPLWNKAREWVAENAPFQQWLGETMVNCLQFYRVNYAAHGERKYEMQRKGGKLYAVLNAKDKPVAAVLINKNGQLIESNGPNNRAPREKDAEYVDKFLEKHLKQSAKDKGAFYPPPDNDTWDPRITRVIEVLLDTPPLEGDIRARRRLIRKATGYSRQAGADFSDIWRQLAIWVLKDSPYSVLKSSERGDHDKQDVIEAARQVVRLYENRSKNRKEWMRAVRDARDAADGVYDGRMVALGTDDAPVYLDLTSARDAAYAAHSAADAAYATDAAYAAAECVVLGAQVYSLVHDGFDPVAHDPTIFEDAAFEAGGFVARAFEAATADYAEHLLKLLREAAQAAGNQPAQPRQNPSDSLIEECRARWEHYCKRPSKKRLKEVFEHLEAMKSSRAKGVQAERRKCLRAANAEAKRLKL